MLCVTNEGSFPEKIVSYDTGKARYKYEVSFVTLKHAPLQALDTLDARKSLLRNVLVARTFQGGKRNRNHHYLDPRSGKYFVFK